MSVTVYGASDDLIEVDGDVREEFYALSDDGDDGGLLAFSNGVVLDVRYRNGVWRIAPIIGASRVEIEFAPEDDDDQYSDRATLTEDVKWVVYGSQFVKAKA